VPILLDGNTLGRDHRYGSREVQHQDSEKGTAGIEKPPAKLRSQSEIQKHQGQLHAENGRIVEDLVGINCLRSQ
jgi:hypothetical protein